MDLHAKQLLLSRVIDYAQKFRNQKRRRNLKSVDVHDALYALGLRPLFADLHVTGDEAVNPADLVGEPMSVSSNNVSLSVSINTDSEWNSSSENFRKRRWPNKTVKSFDLPEKTRRYVEQIIASCHSTLTAVPPPSDRDVLLASWFLGLHFSSIIETTSAPLEWKFIRNAVWFLENAKTVYHRIARTKNITDPSASRFLWAPWASGLYAVSNGHVQLSCVSENQQHLIRSVCMSLI